MILRIACHSVIMLGVAVGLAVSLSLPADVLIAFWLSTTAACALTDWLTDQLPAQANVLDLFEEID